MSKKVFTNKNFSGWEARLYDGIPRGLKKELLSISGKPGGNLNSELMIRLSHSLENFEFLEGLPG